MRVHTISTSQRAAAALLVFFASVGTARVSFAQPAPDSPDASAAAPGVPVAPAAPASDDAGAPAAPTVEPPAAPPAAVPAVPAAPAVQEAAAAPKAEEHAERSPLVPDVDLRQKKTKPIDSKLTLRHGKGLTFASEDGDFEMSMKIRAQILGIVESEHSGENETLLGAQIRRARLAFQGHMFGKHNKYKMEMAVSPRDAATQNGTVGTAPLLDWYMTFDYLKEATVVAGQYKVPFSRQRVVSSGSLQMVDRSIVQSEFNLDRNIGLDIRSTSLLDGHFHYFAGVYAGDGRNSFEPRENDVIYLARVEVLPLGHFSDYVEADFERTGPRVSLGASYAHLSNSPRSQGPLGKAPADGGTTSFDTAEADVLLKMYGLSATAEFFWREGDRKGGDAVDANNVPIATAKPRDGYGAFGQVGFLLPDTMFELTGRYGNLRRSSADKSTLSNRQELGGGVGYYFAQHSFKLQADYFRLWGNDKVSDGTDQVRLQLEAGF